MLLATEINGLFPYILHKGHILNTAKLGWNTSHLLTALIHSLLYQRCMGICVLSFLMNNCFFKKTIVLAEFVVVSPFIFKKVSIFILDFRKGEFMVCIMNLMVVFGNIWKHEIP